MNYLFFNIVLIIHIIAVFCWMAGLFYLPRLFVYHIANLNNNSMHKIYMVMERRLQFYIMFPALILTFITAVILVEYGLYEDFWQNMAWIHIKGICGILLLIFNVFLEIYRRDFISRKMFSRNANKWEKYFRIINEFPTLMLIIIAIVLVFKP